MRDYPICTRQEANMGSTRWSVKEREGNGSDKKDGESHTDRPIFHWVSKAYVGLFFRVLNRSNALSGASLP